MTNTSTPTRSRPRWLIPVGAVALVVLLIVLSFSSSYNGMVHKRNAVDQAFSQVDVELQRQFDLIPNVVNSVKGGQQQERDVIGAIAAARTKYAGATSSDAKIGAANDLSSAFSRLLVIQENYPDLKSNTLVQNLIVEVEGSQNRITQARRDYNTAVTAYNNAIQSFPRNIVAGMFGFDSRTLFVAKAEAATTPTVDLSPTPTTAATAQ